MHSPSTYSGEAGPCVVCGRPSYPVPSGYFRHGAQCGAWMPQAEVRCARRVGHGLGRRDPGHRSPWAMTYAVDRRRAA